MLFKALSWAGWVLLAALLAGLVAGLAQSAAGGHFASSMWALVGMALSAAVGRAMAWGLLASIALLLVCLALGLLPTRRWRLAGLALFSLLFACAVLLLYLAAAAFLSQRLPTSYVGISQGELFRSTIWPAFNQAVTRFGWFIWLVVLGLTAAVALLAALPLLLLARWRKVQRSTQQAQAMRLGRAWPGPLALLGWALVLGLAALLRPAAPAGAPSILLVSIDTLRPDHLGCYGYDRPTSPGLDQFRREAVLFSQTVALSPYTLPSHVSMLTGVNPLVHKVTTLDKRMPESSVLLSELLAAAGYDTGAAVSNFLLGPTFGFDQGFAFYEFYPDRTAEVAAASALRFYEQHTSAARPSFFFLHLMDPHFPYTAPPQQRALFAGADAAGFDQSLPFFEFRDRYRDLADPALRAELIAAYDAEIRYTDEVLSGLLARLKELGLYDSMLIAVTGDHGEEFWEHGGLGHSVTLFDEVLRVPLLIKLPGGAQAGASVHEQVRLSDLTAFLAAAAGLSLPAHAEGVDLAGLISGRPRKQSQPALAMTDLFGPPRYSRRQDGIKWISPGKFQLGRRADEFPELLFDLTADSAELHNLAAERLELTTELATMARQEIEALGALSAGRGPSDAGRLDPRQRERLKALGYLQ